MIIIFAVFIDQLIDYPVNRASLSLRGTKLYAAKNSDYQYMYLYHVTLDKE